MRAIVSVGTGSYVRGLDRLTEWCSANDTEYFTWRDRLPSGSPRHQDVPYAFKSYALREAFAAGAKTLLWCDSSVIPVKPLERVWEQIGRDGYLIMNNGWSNYEWTADSAYPDLFLGDEQGFGLEGLRVINRRIPHVVATTFGVSLYHPTGRAILDEYFRLASETKAFCGPWTNARKDLPQFHSHRCSPCGPEDVHGHRHDQTALSVIAWRLGCELTNPPDIFAYYSPAMDESTVLVADGGMVIK
jgi:hypothetical protein